jgi:tRNA threonylcarbamoyladenosine biosynthesis protein TsaB
LLTVAFDTAASLAGLALSEDEALLGALAWQTHQNHSRELLPNLDLLLDRFGRRKDEIGAVFVCLGPGSYAGLRVGLSTAKALAWGLEAQIAGIGRLMADAEPFALDGGTAVYAVHAAGRAQLAWAAYERAGEELKEVAAPHLSERDAFVDAVPAGTFVCGEIDESLTAGLHAKGALIAPPQAHRAVSIARLGWQRLQRGDVDNAETLVPLYLREPAIGPQPPR